MTQTTIKLTNGTESFAVDSEGMDARGNRYLPCGIGCDHSQAPASAKVWHDVENTETLWEV
jgi:hypothetical protein